MSIVLDTPEQINAWVMISRVSQVSLHLKGYTQKGLAGWLKKNVPAEFRDGNETTVKALTIPLLDWCDSLGIATDKVAALIDGINFQVFVSKVPGGTFYDQGIYETMAGVAWGWSTEHADGRVHIFRTWELVRGSRPLMLNI